MKLTDFARQLPEDVWALFEPLLPPVIWCGNGCPPYSNRECLHAALQRNSGLQRKRSISAGPLVGK